MQPDPHKPWEAAMTRCCDHWRTCFQRALELIDAPLVPPLELCLLQLNWLVANVQRPPEFWLQLLQAAERPAERASPCLLACMQAADGDLARLRQQIMQAATADDPERRASVAALVNAAYTEWLSRSRGHG